MNVDAEPCGVKRLKTLAEQGGDDASEHVARSARRHACVTSSIEAKPRAIGDHGVVAFENDDSVTLGVAPSKLGGRGGSLRPLRTAAKNPLEFTGVRRHNARSAWLGHCGATLCEGKQCVGVNDHRLIDFAVQIYDKAGEIGSSA